MKMNIIKLVLAAVALLITFLCGMVIIYSKDIKAYYQAPVDAPQARPYAVLISTNLVSQNCSCGFCNPSQGTAVPEHINRIGYDLRIEVTTNYLPVVYR